MFFISRLYQRKITITMGFGKKGNSGEIISAVCKVKVFSPISKKLVGLVMYPQATRHCCPVSPAKYGGKYLM